MSNKQNLDILNTDRLLMIVDQTRAKLLLIYLGIFFALFSGNIGGALGEMLPFGSNTADEGNRSTVIAMTLSFVSFYVSARHLYASTKLKKMAPEIYTWRNFGNILDFSAPLALAWVIFIPTMILSALFLALLLYFIPVGIWNTL